MDNLYDKLTEASSYIRSKIGNVEIYAALVLGSGLGPLADSMENPVYIPYGDIPHFPVSTVPGHAGRFVTGKIEGKNILCMQGRFHYYEGYSMGQVVFPIQTMKLLGIKRLILTNAAGCINKEWKPGTLMIINGHIDIAMNENPLRGQNDERLGQRFFDTSCAWDKQYIEIAHKVADDNKLDNIREGVYMYYPGPNFESPADIRAMRVLGADATGMSTVPEAIAAAHCGLRTLGISCMTNMAAGILDQPLSHSEVLETGLSVSKKFTTLIKGIIKEF